MERNRTVYDLAYVPTAQLVLLVAEGTLAYANVDFNGGDGLKHLSLENLLSPFPLSRIASATTGNDTFYVYHQLNGSILIEDMYHMEAQIWTSSNLSVQTA